MAGNWGVDGLRNRRRGKTWRAQHFYSGRSDHCPARRRRFLSGRRRQLRRRRARRRCARWAARIRPARRRRDEGRVELHFGFQDLPHFWRIRQLDQRRGAAGPAAVCPNMACLSVVDEKPSPLIWQRIPCIVLVE
ncbi:MAG: hypothetical protein BJ554DRAFT_4983, partial [Olpidium bornovanus]